MAPLVVQVLSPEITNDSSRSSIYPPLKHLTIGERKKTNCRWNSMIQKLPDIARLGLYNLVPCVL